jgi:hypothetical protein
MCKRIRFLEVTILVLVLLGGVLSVASASDVTFSPTVAYMAKHGQTTVGVTASYPLTEGQIVVNLTLGGLSDGSVFGGFDTVLANISDPILRAWKIKPSGFLEQVVQNTAVGFGGTSKKPFTWSEADAGVYARALLGKWSFK